MQINFHELGVAVYLTPDGPLVADNIPSFEQACREAKERGVQHLVLDLKQVPILDSKGLEFLVDLAAVLRGQGGSLRLASPNTLCAEILDITDLDKTISIFDDIESAGRSFL